jgi:nicotinamide-nucleotide adenylyltransferase
MPFSQSLQRILSGRVTPPIELVFLSHERWPYPKRGLPAASELKISVLDSSFNPPTFAHLALVNHRRPASQTDYDAKLLLLSITNADKKLQSGDATYEQRVEMMMHFASGVTTGDSNEAPGNVAVAIIDEATFAGKASILQTHLKSRLVELGAVADPPLVELTFLQGMDTLERLFAPRYYLNSQEQMYSILRRLFSSESNGSNARVVYATRDPSSYPSSGSSEEQLLTSISAFLTASSLPTDRIQMIEMAEQTREMSSSAARHLIRDGDRNGLQEIVPARVLQYIQENGLYQQAQA